MVGLTERANHKPGELSGGEQQRVAIATTLANDAPVLLADEPTGELDSKTASQIISIFRKIVEIEGITILMTSHDPRVNDFVDETKFLQDGQIFNVWPYKLEISDAFSLRSGGISVLSRVMP